METIDNVNEGTDKGSSPNVIIFPGNAKMEKFAPSVLIVEDFSELREVLVSFAKMFGYECAEASNGVEALEILSRRPFNLVLMDLQMPVMDGYATLAQMKKEGIQTPVYAVTAHVTEEDRALCMRSGFDGFIGKPFTESELMLAFDHGQKSIRTG